MRRPPRRYWRDYRAHVWWMPCLLFVLWRLQASSVPAGPERLDEGMHVVRRVVDSDTLLLASGARLRLQGVDSLGAVVDSRTADGWERQASEFVTNFVERSDRRVRLTFSLERKDRNGRFLAFVWDSDVMLNEELVRAGLARARLDYRFSGLMRRRLATAQDEARSAGRGIWSARGEYSPIASSPR